MNKLSELISSIPRMIDLGLLDCSGGTISARATDGIYVSPIQAAAELDWQLGEDDFVLFPGEGDASHARAGRRPSYENRLHRGILQEFRNWNFTYHGHPTGLLAYAYAGRPLELSAIHARRVGISNGSSIPVVGYDVAAIDHQTAKALSLLQESFSGSKCGAVLIAGDGPVVAATSLGELIAASMLMEKVAQSSALIH